jgi:CheY-like chemotaxis protein
VGLKLRILVAEDNRINQAVITALLEATGHHVHIVSSGYEAVETLGRAQYDVVLMDIQMPDMDGISATKLIRALPAPANSVPVVALTANAMIGDRKKIPGCRHERLRVKADQCCGTDICFAAPVRDGVFPILKVRSTKPFAAVTPPRDVPAGAGSVRRNCTVCDGYRADRAEYRPMRL